MGDLAEDGRAMGMDSLPEAFEIGHDTIVAQIDLREGKRRIRRDRGRAAEDGEPDPAARLLGVI
jgi:hypothetical protein